MSFVPLLSGITAGAAGESYATGDIIEFGYYPQSEVKDTETLKQLNAALKESDWKSYGYGSGIRESKAYFGYIEASELVATVSSDYMKYADTVLNGIKYRAVTFSQFRPVQDFTLSNEKNSNQDENGYYPDNVYWFRFDPLEWTVLDPDSGLVVTKDVIDAQPLLSGAEFGKNNPPTESQIENDRTIFFDRISDWSASSLRKILNEEFLDTVFTPEQQQLIKTTEITNLSENSITGEGSEYIGGEPTEDKCFLLSYEDILKPEYEISQEFEYGSDYAKCQGLSLVSEETGAAVWMLRTPVSKSSNKLIYPTFESGDIYAGFEELLKDSFCEFGIRPAISIKNIAEAETEYILSYNANGGSGAPDNQRGAREYVISSAEPKNGNRHFLGWSEDKASKSADIKPGENIKLRKNTALYAVWSEGLFKATFNAGEGSFTDGSKTKTGSELDFCIGQGFSEVFIFK